MAESLRCPRFRAGQRWLQAAVEVVLAHASITLASSVAHQPAITWGPPTGTRQSLSLWLAEEAAPRHLSFPRALIEDCGAGRDRTSRMPAPICSGVSGRWACSRPEAAAASQR